MFCPECGAKIEDDSKFCTKCGSSLETPKPTVQESSNNSKYIIIALLAIIIILVGTIGYFALNMNSGSVQSSDQDNSAASSATQAVNEESSSSSGESSSQNTQTSSSSQSTTTAKPAESKSWESIGSYSGSGSGSQTINVPAGKIKVELSAFPIKNYADNHLYVTAPNGHSGGVEWGSTSAVETRSDSFEYTSSSAQTITIDYYETVSWQVDFYRYQ